MSRGLKISPHLIGLLVELTRQESAEVMEILELLREVDDLNDLIDETEVFAPLVVHYTMGEHVAVSWRTDVDGVVVTHFDRYRPPPTNFS